MSDRYDENLFLGYVEGELSPQERARFEDALAQDPRLRGLVQQVMADRQAVRGLPREAAPQQVMEAVNQRLERGMLLGPVGDQPEVIARIRRHRFNRYFAYSAVAALLLLSTGIIVHTLLGPVPTTPGIPGTPGTGGPMAGGASKNGPSLAYREPGFGDVSGDKTALNAQTPGAAMAKQTMKDHAASAIAEGGAGSGLDLQADAAIVVTTSDLAASRQELADWAQTNNVNLRPQRDGAGAGLHALMQARGGAGQDAQNPTNTQRPTMDNTANGGTARNTADLPPPAPGTPGIARVPGTPGAEARVGEAGTQGGEQRPEVGANTSAALGGGGERMQKGQTAAMTLEASSDQARKLVDQLNASRAGQRATFVSREALVERQSREARRLGQNLQQNWGATQPGGRPEATIGARPLPGEAYIRETPSVPGAPGAPGVRPAPSAVPATHKIATRPAGADPAAPGQVKQDAGVRDRALRIQVILDAAETRPSEGK